MAIPHTCPLLSPPLTRLLPPPPPPLPPSFPPLAPTAHRPDKEVPRKGVAASPATHGAPPSEMWRTPRWEGYGPQKLALRGATSSAPPDWSRGAEGWRAAVGGCGRGGGRGAPAALAATSLGARRDQEDEADASTPSTPPHPSGSLHRWKLTLVLQAGHGGQD